METVVKILTLSYWPCILCKQGGCLQQPTSTLFTEGFPQYKHRHNSWYAYLKAVHVPWSLKKTVLKVEPMCKLKKLTTQ